MPTRNEKGQFLPGHKPKSNSRKGKKNKSTLILEKLGGDRADELLEKLFELAMEGDSTSLKILADKLWPNVKSSPVRFKLPPVEKVEDLPLLTAALLSAVSEGKVAPDAASQIAALIQSHVKSVELNSQQVELDRLRGIIDVTNN